MSPNVLPLTIGRINLDLIVNHSALAEVFLERYAAFTHDHDRGVKVEVSWRRSQDYPDPAEAQLDFHADKIHLSAPGYNGHFQEDCEARLEITCNEPFAGIDYFLRVVVAALSFQCGGMLFHGAGIVHENRGYVFFGHSGSGKSTVAGYSTNDLVLNDDLILLHPNESGWEVYATPFWNPTQVPPNNSHAPLSALYRLVKDHKVFVKKMSPGQAVGEIAANLPVLPADPRRVPAVLERCKQLINTVPIFWLHFLKDNSFWDVVEVI